MTATGTSVRARIGAPKPHSSRVNVLHVYRTYFPETQGGLEEVIRQISINAGRLGSDNRLFTLSNHPAETPIEFSEITVYQATKVAEIASCGFSIDGFKKFNHLVQWADVIHYHFPWPYADLLHLACRVSKPSVVTYHSDIVRQRVLRFLYTPVMRRFLEKVDRIVCTSPNYFATSDTLSQFQSKVEVIPIGLERTAYPEGHIEKVSTIRATAKPYFLFIGVLRYYKGLHILLDAAKDADYQIVIVGSGPTESELKDQQKKLQLNNVVFTGHVSDSEKVRLIRSSLGVVFPSYLRSEAFGVTLLEGAMFGRPLVSTEVGSGTTHVNIHEETGLVVAPGSAKALRRAMDHLYRNPEAAERMGKNALRRYEALFTGRLMGERYFALYQSLLGRQTLDSKAGYAHRR